MSKLYIFISFRGKKLLEVDWGEVQRIYVFVCLSLSNCSCKRRIKGNDGDSIKRTYRIISSWIWCIFFCSKWDWAIFALPKQSNFEIMPFNQWNQMKFQFNSVQNKEVKWAENWRKLNWTILRSYILDAFDDFLTHFKYYYLIKINVFSFTSNHLTFCGILMIFNF